MRLAIPLFGCLALSSPAFAGDDDAKVHARVEVSVREDAYVGEPIQVLLLVLYDEKFFRDHAVSTFLQPMDVPVKIDAPWLREWKDAVPYDEGWTRVDEPGERLRLALNDGVAEAIYVNDVEQRRSSFGPPDDVPGEKPKPPLRQLVVLRSFIASSPGDLVVPAPTMIFAVASAFKDDLINGRVPVDRRDIAIQGEPQTIHVHPLPEAGRPAEFEGAIGSFTVASEADRAKVEVGEHFHVTLRIEGRGNLANVPTPRLDGLEGFHVFGALDDKKPRVRTIVYDVVAVADDVRELPPISFAYFDPGPPAAYRVARTERIPIEVPSARMKAGTIYPCTPWKPPNIWESIPPVGWIAGGLRLLAFGLYLRARVRAHEAAASPAARRVAVAHAAFRVRVARPDADVAAAVADVLAAHLDCPSAAVVSPDLEARLLTRNWEPALARRTAAAMHQLVAAGYGGDVAGVGVDAVRSLVDEISARAS